MVYSNEAYYKVESGGRPLLVFGDLHYSAIYKGSHINYQEENLDSMARIIELVESYKASAVVLLGDIIGVSERSIRDKRFLLEVTVFFQKLNSLTGGNVYSVRGNHDIGDFPDFEYFKGIGLLKTPTELDYFVDGQLMVRYHFVSYGEERRPLRYEGVEDGVHQIVFGHNDYSIAGVTNWFYSKNSVELATLNNFKHISWVFSGHIHLPSPNLYTQDIGENTVTLFYPGAVSRVASSENYNDCYFVSLFFNEEEQGIDYDIKRFGLKPADQVFDLAKISEEKQNDDLKDEKEENRRLAENLETLMNYRRNTRNILEQVDSIPSVSDEVKTLAKSYLQRAIEEL